MMRHRITDSYPGSAPLWHRRPPLLAASRYFQIQHADDPLSRTGGLKPSQAIEKK